jgi:hypothetical protein
VEIKRLPEWQQTRNGGCSNTAILEELRSTVHIF